MQCIEILSCSNSKKKWGQTDKARSLSHCGLGYQSSLGRLLAGIIFRLNSFQFRS